MDHSELVAALKSPELYGQTVTRVEFLQTHISSLFLTGERVYKLKKPVNFGFVDFSTLARRERFCRAEVELNRRLAPAVYLGAEPVTRDGERLRLGGDGEIVDWVVVMRQLDRRLHGVRLVASGALTDRHLDQVVEILVPFYAAARSGSEVDRYGELDAVRYNSDENFVQTESHVGKLIARSRYEHIRSWTRTFLEDGRRLFERRVAEGRIREGHGDLHLGNMFFEDSPVIFDCVEFSERLRCCDSAADLAFLAMDLDFRGRPDLARHVVDRFVGSTGDRGLVELLDFYRCYRAYVRGKVGALTAYDPALDDSERRRERNRARHYFGLAYRYADGADRPPLLVLHGLMGTGKTGLARALRERFGWHVLSTDAVRKQISGIGENTRVYVPYDEGLYSPEMTRRTYEEVCERAENLLQAGFPVVIDGSFKLRSERLPMIELAERANARLLFLRTVCTAREQRQRLEQRRLHDTRSDGRAELMDRQRAQFESPRPRYAQLFEQLPTGGSRNAGLERAIQLLQDRGLVPDATRSR